jgi:hypothetical protein
MTTARDIIEACAKAALAQRNVVVTSHPAQVEFEPNDMMARRCAAAIRALADQYGNAILCEPEPVGFVYTDRLRAVHSTMYARRHRAIEAYTTPLYRAKEPT